MLHQPTHKNALLLFIMSFIVVILAYTLVVISGVIPNLNSDVDKLALETTSTIIRKNTVEGDIIDRHGDIICSGTEPGVASICTDPHSYGYLVGYNSEAMGAYGLKKTFSHYLINTTSSVCEKAATLQLTTDNQLQKRCYELLENHVGSVIVLHNETGAILAITERGQIPFDCNLITEKTMATYNQYNSFWLSKAYAITEPTGSTAKLLTAAAALSKDENALHTIYKDNGAFITNTGAHISNYNKTAHGEITMEHALAVSSNAYFSSLGVTLGAQPLKDLYTKCLIGQDIVLDFTTLTSQCMINPDEFSIGLTAIGQGKTELTPLHLAAIIQSISNEGVMLTPYLIETITHSEKLLYESNPTALTTTMDASVANKICELMHATALHYGFDEDTYGYVGFKTGTAELANGLNQIYLVGFTGDYTVLMTHRNTKATSSVLKAPMRELIQYLNLHPIAQKTVENTNET